MTEIVFQPATKPLRGTGHVPGDKSITHRALILGALAEGETRIENTLEAVDTQATLNILRALGVRIDQAGASTLIVHGRGREGLEEPAGVLDCFGSGTTLRLMAGVLAGYDRFAVLDGSPALRRRPMRRVIEPLKEMGALIQGRAGDTRAPLAIRGGHLKGVRHILPVASAQVKSALLLAGLQAAGLTTVCEPAPSRDHTERMLETFGLGLTKGSDGSLTLAPAPLRAPAGPVCVPGDLSSAAFLLAAALLMPGSDLRLQDVGVNPTRTGFLDVLGRMGARVRIENWQERNHEPSAGVHLGYAGPLHATEIGGVEVPRLIDELPILAVLATQAEGETIVRDAAELRLKESDRIARLTEELRAMGARIEEHADGFTIRGPTRLTGARVRAKQDHRLAMSLAVAGLAAQGETVIEGWECVADSFPSFEQELKGLQS